MLKDVREQIDPLCFWLDWFDSAVDIKTGLWGTAGCCTSVDAVYGGYHWLLTYNHENNLLANVYGVVDTVLALQHEVSGFNPYGNSGACEYVESIDILVKRYKKVDYYQPGVWFLLRRCLQHIHANQSQDGRFPCNLNQPQSHMGIPGTEAAPSVSCTFPTWFRIHTLALIAEVLPNALQLRRIPFKFKRSLSMGCHSNPVGWRQIHDAATIEDRLTDVYLRINQGLKLIKRTGKRTRTKVEK